MLRLITDLQEKKPFVFSLLRFFFLCFLLFFIIATVSFYHLVATASNPFFYANF